MKVNTSHTFSLRPLLEKNMIDIVRLDWVKFLSIFNDNNLTSRQHLDFVPLKLATTISLLRLLSNCVKQTISGLLTLHIFCRLLSIDCCDRKQCKSTGNFSFAKEDSKDCNFCQTLVSLS